MIPHDLRPTRQTAVLLVATIAMLALSTLFDATAFATTVFPALWITLGLQHRRKGRSSPCAH